jgi:hypothetical protein
MNAYRKLHRVLMTWIKPAAADRWRSNSNFRHAQEAAGPILEPIAARGDSSCHFARGFDIDRNRASPQMLEHVARSSRALGCTPRFSNSAWNIAADRR